jgi:hypothetical protein
MSRPREAKPSQNKESDMARALREHTPTETTGVRVAKPPPTRGEAEPKQRERRGSHFPRAHVTLDLVGDTGIEPVTSSV